MTAFCKLRRTLRPTQDFPVLAAFPFVVRRATSWGFRASTAQVLASVGLFSSASLMAYPLRQRTLLTMNFYWGGISSFYFKLKLAFIFSNFKGFWGFGEVIPK